MRTLLDELLLELSGNSLKKAITFNRKYSVELGWGKYALDIAAKVLQLPPSYSEEAFANATAVWQSSKGLAPDGKFGEKTWKAMKAILSLSASASAGNTAQFFDDNEIRKIFAFLGYDLQTKNLQRIITEFQGDMQLPRNGKWDTKTETKFRELAQQIEAADNKFNPIRRLSRFRLTNYYVADESEFSHNPVVPVLDDAGRPIAWVSPLFFLSMSVEGTGRLSDGRLMNVTGKRASTTHLPEFKHLLTEAKGRYTITDSLIKYTGVRLRNGMVDSVLAFHEVPVAKKGKGYGTIRGTALDPFFTLAADIGAYATSDSRFCGKGGLVPPGTRVFILEYVGKKLPDGRVHNGWFTVNDTGSAIFGAHFDVFTGSRQWGKQLWKPHIGHIWFDRSEQRCPPEYEYGLTKDEVASSQCNRK